MKKKLIFIYICIIAISIFASCGSHLSYEQIVRVVIKNQALLNQVPDEIKKYNEPYVSMTKKRPVENAISVPVPKDIDGLYIIEHIDKNYKISNIENDIFKKVLNIKGIIDIAFYDISEKGRFSVFFSCGGEGIGSAMSEYGFYYTEDNKPIGDDGADYEFMQSEEGWIWTEEDSDNEYYTQRITDNWFYYECSW
jgi:hypothetical protein